MTLNRGRSALGRGIYTAFREGLKEAGFAEGQNGAIEYRSDEYQTDRLPLLVADLTSRQVALSAIRRLPAVHGVPPEQRCSASIPAAYVTASTTTNEGAF